MSARIHLERTDTPGRYDVQYKGASALIEVRLVSYGATYGFLTDPVDPALEAALARLSPRALAERVR